MTDSDVATFMERNLETARSTILHNHYQVYAGLYVQSSGDFVTDYEVKALGGNGQARAYYKVCGAESNFTYVPFIDAEGDGKTTGVNTITIIRRGIASRNGAGTARINEIYPIYVGDDVFDPNNTSPCSASS